MQDVINGRMQWLMGKKTTVLKEIRKEEGLTQVSQVLVSDLTGSQMLCVVMGDHFRLNHTSQNANEHSSDN